MGWFAQQGSAWLAALRATEYARLFGNWLTIIALSTLLVAVALYFGLQFRHAVRTLRAALTRAAATMQDTPEAPDGFAPHYEAARAELGGMPIIGRAWRDWTGTLITEATSVRATVRPNEYLSLELLRNCRVNPRFHAAMPNLLVGAGLLLTFLGLSLALSAAGGIVGADKAARESGLRDLLGTASAKFVFSLVGLACSILYTVGRNGLLASAERALDRLLEAVEQRIPLVTATGLQAEANTSLRELVDAQQIFSNQLAVSIGSKLDEALDARLGEHIGPLRTAIESLAAGIGTRSEDTMQAMLQGFLEQLRGGSDQAMRQVADTLTELARSMADVRSGMAEAASRMASSADQIAEQMSRQAGEAVGRLTLQMEGLVSELRELARQSRDAGSEAITAAAGQIAAAGDAFSATARAISSTVEQALEGMTRRIGSEAEAAARQMNAELARVADLLWTIAETTRHGSEAAASALSDRLAAMTAALEASTDRLGRSLASGGDDAAGKMTAAMTAMTAQFGRLADELGGVFRDAGAQTAASAQQGAQTIGEAAAAAAEALRSGGTDGGDALRRGGAEASSSVTGAAAGMQGAAGTLAEAVTGLQAEASRLGEALASMRDSTVAAAVPLRAAAADLAQAGQSAQAATGTLGEVGRRLEPLSEAVTGSAARLAELQLQVTHLAASVTGAASRFDGVDAELGRVVQQLQAGLASFRAQVTEFATGTNNDMAKATTALSASIIELTEALDEHRPRARALP